MVLKSFLTLVFFSAGLVFLQTIEAQGSVESLSKKAPLSVKTNPWKGQFELGYSNQSGNTNSETLHAVLNLIYNYSSWQNTLALQADNQYTNKQRTVEEYQVSNQFDYILSETKYIFGRLSYDKNQFSGYDFQSLATVGYGYKWLNGPINFLSMEAGAGYSHNKTSLNQKQSGMAGRIASTYIWKITALTDFTQLLSLDTSSENNKVHSETSLETSIIGPLYLKISYILDYNSKILSTFKHTDKKLIASVLYKF